MRFRSYNALWVFDAVARHLSFTAAAEELSQSKGSVSYQIAKLESDLGFLVFQREGSQVSLTRRGERLWHASQVALGQLDKEISDLQSDGSPGQIAVAMLTYFFSRWLSPRLVNFMEQHPGIALRIEPANDISAVREVGIDFGVFWGREDWTNLETDLLFTQPAKPTANAKLSRRIKKIGIAKAVATIPLLADSSGSRGWREWHRRAGLPYNPVHSSLVIPDSNVRVQAVVDGQGIALWDDLIQPEYASGALEPVSEIELDDSGYYLVSPNKGPLTPPAEAFKNWIIDQATTM